MSVTADTIRTRIKETNPCPWWHILDVVEVYEEDLIEEGDSPEKLVAELINLPHVGDHW